jgi:hypothetical protein
MDKELRRLEREAAAGGPDAAARLRKARRRSGKPPLAQATLSLVESRVFVQIEGEDHRVRRRLIPKPGSHRGSGYDGGVSWWTVIELFLGEGDRLWVKVVNWEDIHVAGCWPKGDPRWYVSPDGVTWKPSRTAMPGDGQLLDKASSEP